MTRPLTDADKVAAFKAATTGFARHYADQIAAGMSDKELEAALRDSLGILGGCAASGQLHLTWQGRSLKIWASWETHNHVQDAPLFAGRSTIVMAREVYGIPDPASRQMSLF